jgi:hypothetical protein
MHQWQLCGSVKVEPRGIIRIRYGNKAESAIAGRVLVLAVLTQVRVRSPGPADSRRMAQMECLVTSCRVGAGGRIQVAGSLPGIVAHHTTMPGTLQMNGGTIR